MSPAYPGTIASAAGDRTAITFTTGNGLLEAVAPIWQIVIGVCVLLAVVAASARLARRGRSRMTTALLVIGAAIVSLAVVGVLTSGR
jgi:hypothetical protein